jgi:hypothetical protein
MFRQFRQSVLVLGVAFMLFSCAQQNNEIPAKLMDLQDQYAQDRNFEMAVEILQIITVDYSDSPYAEEAADLIQEYENLQKILLENQRNTIKASFQRINRALENYKTRYLAYPLTPNDLDKLPKVVIPDWQDVWGNPIRYRPTYSEDSVQRHAPDGYVLASFGKDGLPGGVGTDKDYFFKDGKEVDTFIGN